MIPTRTSLPRPANSTRARRILLAPTSVLFFWSSLALSLTAAGNAQAEEPAVPKDMARLILDTGRPPVRPAEEDVVRFQIHGEYQLRGTSLRSFPLDPSTQVINDRAPNGRVTEDSLGLNRFMNHWLRITPRLQVKKWLEIVGQMDVVTGLVLGDLAHDSFADQTPLDQYDGFKNVQPRWLYAQIDTGIGILRVGQQPSHWGMGILANDGDHASTFGDYRYGSIDERILFATKPGGKDSPVTVLVAGDLVYRDANARLTRGDHAFQGVMGALYSHGDNQIGVYGVYRHQTNDKTSGSSIFPYTDTIDAGVLDVTGKFAVPVAGQDAFAYGGFEAAAIFGSTNALRTAEQLQNGTKTTLRSYGGAIQVGVVHRGYDGKPQDPNEAALRAPPTAYGDLVAQIELGYASGDADPYDGTERRFVFDPNHKVGLLLFDQVMRWQTARAASAAQDPLLANGSRPTPGVDLLPTNGGIAGAQYVNPTVIYRPMPWLDLKGGMLLAQATADVVDPYRLATQGSATNYRGGDPKRHDLGLELDAGAEGRFPLDYGVVATLGLQTGVLFPGAALADVGGDRMKLPWIWIARGGLLF